MKKVLFYTDTPQVGGAELQIFLLAKFLNREQFEPILVCSKNPHLDKWCENFKHENIKVYRLNVAHKHDPRHLTQLKSIIKQEQADILHVHVWNPASCRYALSIKNIPILITEHDPFKLGTFKALIKNHLLKNVDKIVAVSDHNNKSLAHLHPDHAKKIVTIKNGIDTTWWNSQLLSFTEADRKKIKEELFLAKEDTLIVTTIAELHERKGQKYLLEAIPKVIEKYPNVKFVFIGDGPNRENLENLREELGLEYHVTFVGRQKGIPKLLKASDIFCLPSRREAFGLVNLEAMITGLPIIATNTGGIPEIVRNIGILVEPKNSETLGKALLHLIPNPEDRADMAAAGLNRIHKEFDAKIMAGNYEKAYSELK